MSKISRIKIDREACIGCGSCAALAPDVFEMDSENKSIVKNPQGASEATIRSAAEDCPADAIQLFDEKGNKIWPKS